MGKSHSKQECSISSKGNCKIPTMTYCNPNNPAPPAPNNQPIFGQHPPQNTHHGHPGIHHHYNIFHPNEPSQAPYFPIFPSHSSFQYQRFQRAHVPHSQHVIHEAPANNIPIQNQPQARLQIQKKSLPQFQAPVQPQTEQIYEKPKKPKTKPHKPAIEKSVFEMPDLTKDDYITDRTGKKIAIIKIKGSEKSLIENCNICSVDFDKKNDNCGLLECFHWYHYQCIADWLSRDAKCPLCQAEAKNIFLTCP